MSIERDIIEKLHSKTAEAGEIPGLGVGDDAAFLVLSSFEQDKLIISTDSLVEGVHYDSRFSSYGDVAAKLFEMNASDILAKGGHPRWALLNMNITREFAADEAALQDFIDVLADKFIESGVALIGGDTTGSSTNTFTITVLGGAHEFIRRGGDLLEGDLLVVSGEIGGSSHAIKLWQEGKTPSSEAAFAHRRPKACWDNRWLFELKAKASIDQSDSVLETLELLSSAADVLLEVELEKLPLCADVKALDQKNLVQAALGAAEDLALFAILPAEALDAVLKNPMLYLAGRVGGKGAQIKLTYEGRPVDPADYQVYHHFEK